MRNKSIFVAVVAGVALLLMACAGAAEPAYQVVSAARISPGSPIPPPSEEVILVISGDIGVTNVGDTLQLDMPTLESLGLVQYTVYDPFLLREDDPFLLRQVTYTGVLLSALHQYVAPSDAAGNFRFMALDDYHVDLPLADIERWPILLATRSDGQYMAIDKLGPTRVIFPYHAHRELDPEVNGKLWIWNVSSLEVN